jgi:hypothetical protein
VSVGNLFDPLSAMFGKAGRFIEGLALGYGLGAVTSEALQPLAASVVYTAHRTAGDGRFDPATAADLWARGIMTQAQAQHEMADQGYGPTPDPSDPFQTIGREGQLYQGALHYPGPGQLLDLLNRGQINDQDYALAMQRQGYQTQQQGWIKFLARTLLSPADLALSTLRGFMDQPTAQAYAATLGVDAADFQTLIDNTGEPPGLMQLLEAYRRGIIDRPTLEHGIRESRVRDEWIPTVEALRYSPMAVADAVMAVVQNHLDHDTAQSYAAENGLDPTQFDVLVANHGRPPSGQQMMQLYFRGLVTRDDVRQAIRESDVKDKYIDAEMQLGRRLIPERQITTMMQHGVMTRDQGIAYLMMQGYNQQDAEWLIALGQQEHHLALKQLTVSEIQTLYEEKTLTRDQAMDHLASLGYDPHTSGYMLDLADIKHAAQLARMSTAAIRASYLKHDIGRAEAIDRLMQAGTPEFMAKATVDEWEIAHAIASKDLTESQTVKAASDGVIAVEEAAARLLALGYTRTDATILLQTAGLVEYTSRIAAGWKPAPPGSLFNGRQPA